MRTNIPKLTTAAFAALIVNTTTPAVAEEAFVDPFILANRAAVGTATRKGDVPAATTIRTDERYNTGSLFSGPRGWVYWNYRFC